MKYLFITQLFPSGLTGTAVKTRNTIKHLLNQGHQIDVCCVHSDRLVRNEFSHQHLQFYLIKARSRVTGLLQFWLRGMWLLLNLAPFKIRRVYDGRLEHTAKNLISTNNYDQIFFDGFTTLQYILKLKKQKNYIYIDDEDITDLFYQRMYQSRSMLTKVFYLTEWLRALVYERRCLARVAKIWAISTNTARRLDQLSTSKTTIMPTVIPLKKQIFNISSKHIVFTGTLNWPENVAGLKWFVSCCWLSIKQRHPDKKLLVVGQLLEQELRNFLNQYDGVELLGYVDDLAGVYKKAALAISPVFINSGIKIKVLTYLSYGLPVVVTPESILGLSAEKGIVKATKKDFLNSTLALLNNDKKRVKLAKQAQNYIRKYHSERGLKKFFKENLE